MCSFVCNTQCMHLVQCIPFKCQISFSFFLSVSLAFPLFIHEWHRKNERSHKHMFQLYMHLCRCSCWYCCYCFNCSLPQVVASSSSRTLTFPSNWMSSIHTHYPWQSSVMHLPISGKCKICIFRWINYRIWNVWPKWVCSNSKNWLHNRKMFKWKMENSIRWKREKFDFECNFSWRKAFFLVFIDRNFGCSWRMEEFETFRAELANETTISKCKFEFHRRWRCKCAKAKGIDIALFHSLPFVCVCIRCSFLTLPRALHDCHWKSDRSENWRQTQPNNTHTYSHATRSIPSNAMCELHCCNWKRGRTTTTTTRTKTVKWEVKRGVDIRKSVVYD